MSLALLSFLGTPITRPPVLGNQDLDLHKLYKIVQEHGGMEKVTAVNTTSLVDGMFTCC